MTRLAGRAFPVVLAAPSGTGKTTIARALVGAAPEFVFSVSATTRPPREGEREGYDYHFVGRPEFEAMIEAGELVEWAEVHGHLYGTPRANLAAAADRGEHVVLDIDVQGARQIRDREPEAVLIFVFPPSLETLLERLEKRGTERPEEVARRLRNARQELERAADFDYVVVNDDLDEAVAAVRSVVEAEAHRPVRTRELAADVTRLREAMGRVLEERYANVNR